MRMLDVSGSYQNCKNGVGSNQQTGIGWGGGGGVKGSTVAVDVNMFDIGGAR